MPATTKKPIKIVPNTIKTIPKVPLSPISKSKSFQEKLNDIQNNIDINIDDIPEDLLDIWDELQEDITPKLISKNYKLWLTIFTPFILPGIINGMSGKPAVPQPVVTVQEPAPDPKQIVNFAQKYFAEHGLELCKSLTKTDLNSMKQDLINNWGKGPDVFSKTFQDSYPVSKSRLENIYRSERHLAEYNGVLERAKIADHKYKQWRAVGDERSCDLCMSHDMETVPINEPFSNGEMTATGHPQCRCSMVTYSEDDYDEIKEDSAYLSDAFETIKQNYKCKAGTVDDSNKCGLEQNTPKESIPQKNIATSIDTSEPSESVDNALQDYEKSILSKLTPEESKFIDGWPAHYTSVNDALFDKREHPSPMTELQHEIGIPVMDNIMKQSVLNSDIVVYRGMDEKKLDSLLEKFEPGTEFTYPGFMSTSTSKKWSRNFFADEGGTFRIEVPKGTNAIYIHKHQVNSRVITERELILNRDLTFRVKSITEEPGMHHPLKIINIEVVQ